MSFIPEVTKPVSDWPKSLVIASPPKTGKSTIAADFTTNFKPGESVILSIDEQSPYDLLESSHIQFTKLSELESYLDKVIQSGKKIPFAFVDHLTKIDELSELMGTIEYMQTPQGKSFNRDKKGNIIPLNSSQWRSVHELANGAGYRFSRGVMMRIKSKCHQAIEHVVFFVHLKDKDIVNTEGQTLRIEKKISLTGKLSTIVPAYVNGVCYMYPDETKRYLDFEASAKSALGATLEHLNGQILISDKTEKGIVTYWDKIYPPKK